MMEFILTILAVFVVLMGNELWWRSRTVHSEFSRKFVHLTVGSFVAAWPFFLTWHEIELLSLAFLVVVTASKFLHIFQAIHSVQRPTWGELFFAISVGSVAVVTHDKWIYAAALLQMALADGLAAIVGVHYGNHLKLKYLVFGHAKSVTGTLTFFVVSIAILLAFEHWSGVSLGFGYAAATSALATVLENLGVFGLDNVLVPLAVALMLVNR
jgi:phytol kinase